VIWWIVRVFQAFSLLAGKEVVRHHLILFLYINIVFQYRSLSCANCDFGWIYVVSLQVFGGGSAALPLLCLVRSGPAAEAFPAGKLVSPHLRGELISRI
jgi:hypothetical protein